MSKVVMDWLRDKGGSLFIRLINKNVNFDQTILFGDFLWRSTDGPYVRIGPGDFESAPPFPEKYD